MSWFRRGGGTGGKPGKGRAGGGSARTSSLDSREVRNALARGKKAAQAGQDQGPSTEDLILSGQLDGAEEQLRKKLKASSGDHHARLKLAEVLEKKQELDEALVEYVAAADTLTREGFYDHAEAVLRRAGRLAPSNPDILARQQQVEERKQLEQVRRQAVSAMSQASMTATGSVATAAIELEQIWDRLARTVFIRSLPADQVVRLLAQMRLRRFAEGESFVQAGSQEDQILLICFGELEALTPLDPTGRPPTSLRTFSVGEVLGESTLLEHQPWPVSLRVSQPGSALVLERDGLEKCLVGNSDPRSLLQGLRQQRNDQQLRDMCAKLGGTAT